MTPRLNCRSESSACTGPLFKTIDTGISGDETGYEDFIVFLKREYS